MRRLTRGRRSGNCPTGVAAGRQRDEAGAGGPATGKLARVLRLVAGTILIAAAVAAAWVYRELHRDPMPLLDRGVPTLAVAAASESSFATASGERRRLVELVLDGAGPGPIRAAVSLPAEPPARPLPALIVLGGLEVGRDSLRYVAVHGPNAIVAPEYPRSATYWYEGTPLAKLPAIRESVLAMPSRTAGLAAWIRAQTWADPDRVSLLGYSFGAFFVPACARVARRHDQGFRTLVMAYGGADLPAIFDANVRLRPRVLQWSLGRALAAVVHPIEPALHLPSLSEDALLINGLRDRKVPWASARLVRELKPEPKTSVELDAAHMDPANPALTAEIVRRTREWLIARGALDP